ncbi:MAG: Trm112 family protein [Acidobacteriota bacterium]
MSASEELLEILVCPKSRGALEWVDLPEPAQQRLADKYREHFDGEEPEVAKGLLCRESELVYPVVADIPVMLVEEALPASVLDES